MFIKHKTFTKPIFGARLRYILREDAIQDGFVIKQLVRGNTIPEIEQFFLENETCRKVTRKDSVRIREFYLSFNPGDTEVLTSEILMDIARHFMKRFDPMTPGIAVPHFDKDHVHIHVILAGIQYKTGKSNDKNNKEFAEFKKAVERYHIQKYPQIEHSNVQTKTRTHQRSQQNDRAYRVKQRTGKSIKEVLRTEIEKAMEKSKSINQLKEQLRQRGIDYYRNSEARQGVVFEGKKFRFATLGLINQMQNFIEKSRTSELGKEKGRKV